MRDIYRTAIRPISSLRATLTGPDEYGAAVDTRSDHAMSIKAGRRGVPHGNTGREPLVELRLACIMKAG